MSGARISDMTSRTALVAGDMVPVISGGGNYKFDLGGALGASNLTVGLFTGLSGQDLTAGGTKSPPDFIFTSGYSTPEIGAASYKRDTTVTSGEASSYPRFCFRDSQGNGYRIYGSTIELDAIGAIPDNSTDNFAVLQDLDTYGVAHRRTPLPQDGVHGRVGLDFVSYPPFAVKLSRGGYYCSGTWLPSLPWYLFAYEGNGVGGGSHTVFIRWANNVHGVIPNSSSTRGDQYTGALTQFDASGITFDGIALLGGGTDRTKHGLWARTKFVLRNCAIDGFPGDNLHISANTGSVEMGTNLLYGNANASQIVCNAFSSSGRHAVYVEGADANACLFVGNNVISAGAGAFIDQSFLGNIYLGNNVHGYDLNGQGRVAFGGNIYDLIDPTPGIGAATTPGTNSIVWYPRGAGTFTAWSNVGTYYPCCPILIFGPDNRSVMVNPYIEGGTGAISHVAKPARCINPNADPQSEAFTVFSAVESTSNDTGSLNFNLGVGSWRTPSYTHEVSVGGGEDTTILRSNRSDSDTFRMVNLGGGGVTMSYNAVGASQTWQYWSTVGLFGRGVAANYVHLFTAFALGVNTTAARLLDMQPSDSASATGRANGEFLFNNMAGTSTKERFWQVVGGVLEPTYRRLYGSKTYDPPSIAAGASTTTTVTVTGVAAGDMVSAVDFGASIQPLAKNAWVSGTNAVTVELSNPSAGAIDLGSMTLSVEAVKRV